MKILIVSDIHGNRVALEAFLAASQTFDAIWSLGDTVGYGPRPRECVDLMVQHGAGPVLVGNHDLAAIGQLDLADFNPVARTAARWTGLQLGPEHQAYLAALPPATSAEGYTLAHGSPRAPIWEYVADAKTATDNFAFFDTVACFIGHTHLAMYAALGDGRSRAEMGTFRDGETLELRGARFLVNPGSVGQPRDGDPRAAYAILDTNRAAVSAHRVTYDIGMTQHQMSVSGLPEALIARLALGV